MAGRGTAHHAVLPSVSTLKQSGMVGGTIWFVKKNKKEKDLKKGINYKR